MVEVIVSSTKIKSKQLGVNFSTASHQLKRMLMLKFAKQCGEDKCFRCGKKIEHHEDFSLDHKADWLHTPNAKELFWDLDNISLSHKSCNIKAGLDKRTNERGITEIQGRNKKFQVRRWDGKKQILVGYYETIQEARQARDAVRESVDQRSNPMVGWFSHNWDEKERIIVLSAQYTPLIAKFGSDEKWLFHLVC